MSGRAADRITLDTILGGAPFLALEGAGFHFSLLLSRPACCLLTDR